MWITIERQQDQVEAIALRVQQALQRAEAIHENLAIERVVPKAS